MCKKYTVPRKNVLSLYFLIVLCCRTLYLLNYVINLLEYKSYFTQREVLQGTQWHITFLNSRKIGGNIVFCY